VGNPPGFDPLNASPFKIITPTSGKNLPYEPEALEYP